jgi:hypothetical protein
MKWLEKIYDSDCITAAPSPHDAPPIMPHHC